MRDVDSNEDDATDGTSSGWEDGPVGVESGLEAIEPREIGAGARALDSELTTRERMHLPRSTLRRLGLLGVVYAVSLLVLFRFYGDGGDGATILPIVVLVALLVELADSAAGMGFGTALAPLLFVVGYDPLQVAPALLVSEAVTGGISGGVHHELENASFSLRPVNDATRATLLLGGVGAVGSVVSITLTYFLLPIPDAYVETYVAVLVFLMGATGVLRARLATSIRYRPRRLVAFAMLAGFNKGIGGGGYGPVVTLGQILSGVYEKSATAVSSLAESIVSLVGVVTFLVLSTQGVAVEYTLVPSVYAGGFLAAVGAPCLVRIVPNRFWRYAIPLYTIVIGLLGLAVGLAV